jgi:hypothetical protein
MQRCKIELLGQAKMPGMANRRSGNALNEGRTCATSGL